MSTRSWPPETVYGLDHPTWYEAGCFFYSSHEKAEAAILLAYGPDSGHVVIYRGPVSS